MARSICYRNQLRSNHQNAERKQQHNDVALRTDITTHWLYKLDELDSRGYPHQIQSLYHLVMSG